jgi:hypothetical protein
MNQKFHCDRLLLNKKGSVKEFDRANGGGTRDCIWDHIGMKFMIIFVNFIY